MLFRRNKNTQSLFSDYRLFLGKFAGQITHGYTLSFLCLFIIIDSFAQKPNGRFIADSIEIGKPIDFVLSYRHSPTAEIFFPDTTYNFQPFELVRRNYFPTKTDAKGSLDSAVYTLVSFDIQKVQKLSIPIYILNQQDCTAVYSSIDSVFLKEIIKGGLDSLTLKTDTQFIHIEPQINYPKIFGYLLTTLIVIATIYLFFGKYIRKQFGLFRFSRKHNEFLNTYKKLTRGKLDDVNISKAIVLWKKHLEWLEKKPYTSYTTKEIITRLTSMPLEQALRDVDTAIYGGIISSQMPSSMNVLLTTAVELYNKRKQELSNS